MTLDRTSLTKYAPSMRDPDPDGAHKLAARMWHEQGHVAFRRETLERLPWQDRELIEQLATRIFGPREQN